MSSNKKKRIIQAITAVMGLLVLYFSYQHIMYATTDNAQVDAHYVMLAAKVGGYVTKVNVIEGQKVGKDDVLVEIDDRDYQNALKQLQSEMTSVEAGMRDTEKNYSRISSLFSGGAVSRQQYDAASTARTEVKAKYDAISAQVAQAELNLESTKIKAPSDGFIAKRSVEVGQLASPGIPLLGFVDANERWVTANFKETKIQGVKVGHAVDIKIDAISGKTFHGIVESISSATGATFSLLPPDNATGNFTKVVQRVPVKIKFENLTPKEIEILRVGLSAVVKAHK